MLTSQPSEAGAARGPSKSQTVFSKLLRALQTGGVCYDDFLSHLDDHLSADVERDKLLEILRQRDAIEPFADTIYLAIWSRLRGGTSTAVVSPES